MADSKISALPDVVTLAAGDKVPIADASDLSQSKSATMTEINTYIRKLPLVSTEVTTLSENTVPLPSDLVLIIDDPSGTPLAQKITINNLMSLSTSYLVAIGGYI